MHPHITRREWLLTGGALLSGFRLSGQQAEVKYSTDVNVVNVLATVRDRQGRLVRDLTKEEFIISENGRRQTVRYFSPQSDLPLTLGLLVDVSGSQGRLMETERSASYRFLDQVLREDRDFAFVIHFAGEVELLEDLVASRKLLRAALARVGNPPPERSVRGGARRGQPRGPASPGGPSPRGGGRGGLQRAGGTSLHDAVFLAADELMRKQQGRKALILISDGVDTASKISLDKAIETSQRADTLVYSLRYYDDDAYGWDLLTPGTRARGRMRFPDVDGKDVLKRLSRQTGGAYFEPSNKQPVDKIFSQIEEELRSQYNLGYTYDQPAYSGEFRKIRVEVKRRGLTVQAREGYYAR
jgi:VWFA-related protein